MIDITRCEQEKTKDEPAEKETDNSADKDIARIMEAKIDARIAGKAGPEEDGDRGEDIQPAA